MHPTRDEGYGRLDLQTVNPDDPVVYEEIKNDAPVTPKEGGPPRGPQMDKHPRVLARKASDKFKEEDGDVTALSSRDRSKLPAYQHDDSVDAQTGGQRSRLPPKKRAPPPVPHPKRQKMMQPQQGDEVKPPTGISGSAGSPSEVPISVLEEAGYETVNTFSPPPEEMETETKEHTTARPSSTQRVSPVSPRARGPKPPPLPKPKQILPAAQSGEKTAASVEESESGNEPINVYTPDPSSLMQENGACDMEPMQIVSSPKVELDIDHIVNVGSALMNQGGLAEAGEEEAMYDNQRVVDAFGLDHSPQGGDNQEQSAQQKRTSRTSYENQIVVDAVSYTHLTLPTIYSV